MALQYTLQHQELQNGTINKVSISEVCELTDSIEYVLICSTGHPFILPTCSQHSPSELPVLPITMPSQPETVLRYTRLLNDKHHVLTFTHTLEFAFVYLWYGHSLATLFIHPTDTAFSISGQ